MHSVFDWLMPQHLARYRGVVQQKLRLVKLFLTEDAALLMGPLHRQTGSIQIKDCITSGGANVCVKVHLRLCKGLQL